MGEESRIKLLAQYRSWRSDKYYLRITSMEKFCRLILEFHGGIHGGPSATEREMHVVVLTEAAWKLFPELTEELQQGLLFHTMEELGVFDDMKAIDD